MSIFSYQIFAIIYLTINLAHAICSNKPFSSTTFLQTERSQLF